ncbi:MAG: hypothetical protein IK137_02100 [Bacilli bacterium]|nr:hypothetical protein [Bacilli bacterium]
MKEKINEYIATRIEIRNEIIEKELREKKTKETVGLLISLVFNIGGLSVAIMNPVVGGAIAIISAAVFCLKVKNFQKLEIREKRINNEIRNLVSIETDSNSNIEEKNQKLVQIRKAEELRKEIEEEYRKAKVYTFISYGITTVGFAGLFINPVLGLIALPGIICNAVTAKNEVIKYTNCQLFKNLINNLKHDVEVMEIKEGLITKESELEINELNNKERIVKIEEKNKKKDVRINDVFDEVYYGENAIHKPKEYRKVR